MSVSVMFIIPVQWWSSISYCGYESISCVDSLLEQLQCKKGLKRFTKTIKYQREFQGIDIVIIGDTISKQSKRSHGLYGDCRGSSVHLALPVITSLCTCGSISFWDILTVLNVLQQSFDRETSAVVLKKLNRKNGKLWGEFFRDNITSRHYKLIISNNQVNIKLIAFIKLPVNLLFFQK